VCCYIDLIQVVNVCVLGAFLLYAIEKFVWNLRLAYLLRFLVMLFGLLIILQRLLPKFGIGA
jgi:uncharacterized membrane protein required for colicin V production